MSILSRGTTPTYLFTFPENEADLTQAAHVYVTFESNHRKLRKKDADLLAINPHSIGVYLTQAETLSFGNTVEVQINWTYADGSRSDSYIATIETERNLEPEVLE